MADPLLRVDLYSLQSTGAIQINVRRGLDSLPIEKSKSGVSFSSKETLDRFVDSADPTTYTVYDWLLALALRNNREDYSRSVGAISRL